MKIHQSYLFGGIILVLVIISLNSLFIIQNRSPKSDSKNSERQIIDKDTYQAVFLNNNQIYFGHLHDTSSDYLVLSDVYYIQLTQESSKKGQPVQEKGRLIRLGDSEPHRPQNEMILNKEHILFWENLRTNSPIVNTIQSMNVQRK